MKLTEVKIEDLSEISYRILLYECSGSEGKHPAELLLMRFVGSHGIGSEGNNDSLFMATVIEAALNIWRVDGLVLDFTQLAYEWGDTIGDVLTAGKDVRGKKFPTAVVVSGICKPALESAYGFYSSGSEIDGQSQWLFDDLESAVAYVEQSLTRSK